MGLPGISWRDGGVTLPSLRKRQNMIIIRTIGDMMTLNDPKIPKMMEYLEQEQAEEWNMGIAERENESDRKVFVKWTGQNHDRRKVPVAQLHSILPGAFKAHPSHETAAEGFTVSKLPRPAMWITQGVMRKNHWQAFCSTPLASRGRWDLEDNPVSNHFLNWATSKNGFYLGKSRPTRKSRESWRTDGTLS
jgi:hypothetical protein